MTRLIGKTGNPGRWLTWCGFAFVLLAAPYVFNQGAALSILSQMGTLIVFALSFNMLLGQGGMLTLGHAVYSGLGAYVAIHALNLTAAGALSVPVTLIPLVGGLGGMGFGILFGYVTTKKSGTAFAMITLGMVELVFACALMFSDFFGGEGGITANRVIGEPVLGISYGPQIQVYYLLAFWLFVCTAAMYAFTRTPLGRILNAVRDNPERAEFIGYNPQRVRYLGLILSAFFAGISGGLAAINFEIVSAENVSAMRSAWVLLSTFIGGIGFFFGPMIGAIVGVFMTAVLSEYTKAWQLYLGALFVLMVMLAPGGIAGLVMMTMRLIRFRKLSAIAGPMAVLGAAALPALCSLSFIIEMLYQRTLESTHGSIMPLFGMQIDTAAPLPWFMAVAVCVLGWTAFLRARVTFRRRWNDIDAAIAVLEQRGEA